MKMYRNEQDEMKDSLKDIGKLVRYEKLGDRVSIQLEIDDNIFLKDIKKEMKIDVEEIPDE